DGASSVGRVLIVPEFAAGACVGCPDVVGRREVENSVDEQGRGLDLDIASADSHAAATASTCSESRSPRQRKRVDIGGIDLGERDEAATGVIAVVAGPGVSGRMKQIGLREALRQKRARGE